MSAVVGAGTGAVRVRVREVKGARRREDFMVGWGAGWVLIVGYGCWMDEGG